MFKVRLTSTLLSFSVLVLCQIPPGYYDSVSGMTGEPMRIELGNIIDNHTVINYSDLWQHFPNTDDNGSGKVWDIYSYSPSGSAYTYNFGSDQCGNYSNEGDCYNREHSVPQSWFNGSSPMYSDLFHIYPTDGYVNGIRSNNVYGEVNSPSTTTTNGSKSGNCSYPGCSGTAFEPIDEFKGDIARTYFYMATRYRTQCSSWGGGMFQGDNLATWVENMLLAWDDLDPVSQKEIDRNNAIYNVQGNRNPYIDHPEWVEYVWGPIASVKPHLDIIEAYVANCTLYINDTETIQSIEVYALDGRLVSSELPIKPQIQLNELNTGVYLISVQTAGSAKVLKVVL